MISSRTAAPIFDPLPTSNQVEQKILVAAFSDHMISSVMNWTLPVGASFASEPPP
jgi:hypothetical protein